MTGAPIPLSARDERRRFWNATKFPEPRKGVPAKVTDMILLVHGYNNDRKRADNSYCIAEKLLQDRYGVEPQELANRVVEFFWPGDHLRMRSVSTPLYSLQVRRAQRVGQDLAEYLAGLHSPTGRRRLSFVGHSLGCRVIAETIHALRQGNRDGVIHRFRGRGTACTIEPGFALLMAAAVPVAHMEQTGQFADGLNWGAIEVMHSLDDTALGASFSLGQKAARDGRGSEGWPEAVGRRGRPGGVWSKHHPTRLAHGDYWSSPAAMANVHRLMKPERMGESKRLVERSLGSWLTAPERLLPSDRRDLSRRCD